MTHEMGHVGVVVSSDSRILASFLHAFRKKVSKSCLNWENPSQNWGNSCGGGEFEKRVECRIDMTVR